MINALTGPVAAKTWLSDEAVLDLVGTRITTHGAKGCVVQRKGEPELHVGVVEATEVVDPTGVGDAFRAGFLAATAWGLALERACQVGSLLATHVVETVGTQEYTYDRATFLARLAGAYGEDAATEVAPHLS